jgi:general nucleoside transport system permease protein
VMRLLRRPAPSRAMLWCSPLIAVALTFALGAALFAAMGQPPLAALHALFVSPLSDMNGVAELLLKASPLCLIALGLAVGFRSNIWNVGAEGQMYIGAVFASGLAIHFQARWGGWMLPAMILAGIAGGLAWAAIVAALRAHLHASEILVSLMLTYVAALIVKYLVFGPWQDPAANNFPFTVSFEDNALFSPLMNYVAAMEGTRLNTSLLLTLVAIPLTWIFLKLSFTGFQLRVAGDAPAAARYAGHSEKRAIWIALLVSGAAAGLAGVTEVAGPIGQLNDRWTPGYGFTAIIVAALGRLHPAGIAAAALLMALLYIGGETAQVALQLPRAIAYVFQGLLLMALLACEVLVHFRLQWTASTRSSQAA